MFVLSYTIPKEVMSQIITTSLLTASPLASPLASPPPYIISIFITQHMHGTHHLIIVILHTAWNILTNVEHIHHSNLSTLWDMWKTYQ